MDGGETAPGGATGYNLLEVCVTLGNQMIQHFHELFIVFGDRIQAATGVGSPTHNATTIVWPERAVAG